jgi:hypothetical protein
MKRNITGSMIKGPLVKAAFVLAAILMVMSVAIVLKPEYIEIIGALSGIVAVATIAVLLAMLFRMRKV